jgi:hypothetical protein
MRYMAQMKALSPSSLLESTISRWARSGLSICDSKKHGFMHSQLRDSTTEQYNRTADCTVIFIHWPICYPYDFFQTLVHSLINASHPEQYNILSIE